jgi:hypothetical protein
MRTTCNFAPLWRSTIGFDRLLDLVDAAQHGGTEDNSGYENPSLEASCLLFVRLAHDRRFVGAVLLFVVCLFVLVLFVFIRISGRHRVARDHEGTPVDQPSGKVLGDVWGHVVPPRGGFSPGVHRPAGYVAAQLPNTG